ncbi:MAG: hypothetical protein IT306_10110 [Chloroflexi bacterium]|nr:hypothetical protein [Chloroflexota bacterium]
MTTRTSPRSIARWLGRAVFATSVSLALIGPVGPALAATDGLAVVQQAADVQTADVQTNVGGGVTVKVSRLESAEGLAFKIVLDTHSVNLDRIDLGQLAVLRTEQGEEIAPLAWEAPAGGHHREGTLMFPTTTADGLPLFEAGAGTVELVIRDVAGVAERAFRWVI